MIVPVCAGLTKCWPWTSSAKQVLMLNVLEEVLELAGAEACAPVLPSLTHLLSRCLAASHFQVVERALLLWHNHALAAGVLGGAHAGSVLPRLLPPLQRLSAGHWNPSVHALAGAVLKHYEEVDSAAYYRCAAAASASAAQAAQAALVAGVRAGGGVSVGGGAAAQGSKEEALRARREAWRQFDAAAAAAAAASR